MNRIRHRHYYESQYKIIQVEYVIILLMTQNKLENTCGKVEQTCSRKTPINPVKT